MLGLRCCVASLYSQQLGLLSRCVPVASFVAERGLQGMQASAAAAHRLSSCGPGLWRTDWLIAAAHGLSCSMVCGIFPDQRSNLRLLHWQADSLPLSHRGALKLGFWRNQWLQSPWLRSGCIMHAVSLNQSPRSSDLGVNITVSRMWG